jgi:ribonucleotide monophosphatase NagD (HAD superfamily)
MVGDRPETDGLFAERLGCRFALVRSGSRPVPPTPSTARHRRRLDVADLPRSPSLIMTAATEQ